MISEARQILERAGIKPTPNRLLVADALLGADCPMGLPELDTALPTLEKSSIFRVLNLLLASHVVHVLEDGRGIAMYEICHSTGEHSDDDLHPHFYCTGCHRTFCLHDSEVPRIPLPDGFRMDSVNYMVKGLCPSCAGR